MIRRVNDEGHQDASGQLWIPLGCREESVQVREFCHPIGEMKRGLVCFGRGKEPTVPQCRGNLCSYRRRQVIVYLQSPPCTFFARQFCSCRILLHAEDSSSARQSIDSFHRAPGELTLAHFMGEKDDAALTRGCASGNVRWPISWAGSGWGMRQTRGAERQSGSIARQGDATMSLEARFI